MLRLLMLSVSVVLVALVVTQLLIPAFKGGLFFPLFRSKIRKAEADLARRETGKVLKELEVSALRLEQESQQHIHEALDELIDDNETKINKGKG